MTIEEKFEKKLFTKKSVDTPRWYTDVIQLAQLADYGPVRGTMVIRPYGYAIWEFIQREFDKKIKKLGVENAYFPLFIPMHLLEREKKHVEGFAPELAVVTHGGGKKLDEPLAIRPTSETIMYEMYSKWIHSWRDLPLLLNQWNNVVRWEKRTYFFLRTLEFLWQEGHTAHATYDEAEKMVLAALKAYEDLYRDTFALPAIVGIKSDAEKFAGADHTYAIELIMPDGKVLQAATSHHLGDNFSKPFNISFQDKDGENKFVFQTSWGLSTRSIGGLILAHGDDKGLIIPPKLAPIRIIIIPVLGKRDGDVLKYCQKVKATLEEKESTFPGLVKIDDDPEKSYGWKVNEAELKGIPLRIAVGSREVDERTVSFSPRVEELNPTISRLGDVFQKSEELLSSIQNKMLIMAEKNLAENTTEAKTYDQFKKIMSTKRGFIKAYWCGDPKCEQKIKEETKAATRVSPFEKTKTAGKCIYCGNKAQDLWYFGQPY
jgi:prolyl-tRNA synthetase